MIKICIIDYGLGNIASMFHAVKSLDKEVVISKNKEEIKNSSHLILPGVGSFKSGMKGLEKNDLIEILSDEVLIKKKPILGVCLGMQLFLTEGSEDGVHKGLNWIEGNVTKINNKSNKLKIPHMGWNEVNYTKKNKLFSGVTNRSSFYFVHSYHVVPNDQTIISGSCFYGEDLVASIEKDNIFATQFHPEKSHNVGSLLLKNFLS